MIKNFIISVLSATVTYQLNIWSEKSAWLYIALFIFYEMAIQCSEWFMEERKAASDKDQESTYNVSVLRRYKRVG